MCWPVLPLPFCQPESYTTWEKSQFLPLQSPLNSCKLMSRVKSSLLMKGTGKSLSPCSRKMVQKNLSQGREKQRVCHFKGLVSVVSSLKKIKVNSCIILETPNDAQCFLHILLRLFSLCLGPLQCKNTEVMYLPKAQKISSIFQSNIVSVTQSVCSH